MVFVCGIFFHLACPDFGVVCMGLVLVFIDILHPVLQGRTGEGDGSHVVASNGLSSLIAGL